MLRRTITSSALFGLLVSSTALAANFSQPGPVAFTEAAPPTGFLPGNSDISVITPNAAGQYPLVVATHGWSAGRVNQMGWARHLASYGYVVIVPGMPNPLQPDQAVWSANIRTIAQNATNASLFPQIAAKIDKTKIVYEGFSAGGLASTLAAKVQGPTLLVLLDPVDNNNQGATAMPSICSPVLSFFTQPSGCNNQMGWSAYASTGTGPFVRIGVKASTHCDGEDEGRALCGTFCGGAAKTTNRDNIRKYMVAYLEWKLRRSQEAAALFAPSALSADPALEGTSVVDRPACGGAPAVDAGTPAGTDAGTPSTPDAGTPAGTDAGTPSTPDAGLGATDGGAGNAGASSDGGCACSTVRATKFSPLALFLALVPFVRRRRSR